MRTLVSRRPELLLLASLLVFAAVLLGRQVAPVAPVATTMQAQQPLSLGAERTVNMLKARVREHPDDTAAYAQLGLALLQRVRETGDVGLYAQAEQAFDAALERDPKQLDALIGQGTLALARHRFADALDLGERARAENPYRAAVYGVIGDALTELGRYDEAAAAVDTMVETRPDLSSYSRVAYQRELRGDIDGAIQAFELAISAGGPASENTAWTQVQLGNLYFNNGKLAQAEQTYLGALNVRPDDAYARAGLAKVRAARGELTAAIGEYQAIVQRLPLPEFVIALGELYEVTGQDAQAQAQYELVRSMQQLNAGAGMDVDLELALFNADQGDTTSETVALARAAYERHPSIHAADALAWTLYQAGEFEEAARYSGEALRLGTRDAAMHYRAGMIAKANGDPAQAREHLQAALEINPHFSVLHAGEARALLAQLAK